MDCRECSSHIDAFHRWFLLWAFLSIFALAGCTRASHARIENSANSQPQPAGKACQFCEDSDRDGIPDTAELHTFDDRENFRRWFTTIAEMQYYRVSETWNEKQRDCAGLVRFAWREALRSHDRLWFQTMGEGYDPVVPDVGSYSLGHSPLGEKIFRNDLGSFEEGDLAAKKFSEFADARTLKNYNTVFISRDRKDARAGDLIFFHRPEVRKYPYHVMIVLGEAHHAGEGAKDWVVYHTGSSPADQGEVKKVRLSVLDQHPDRQWRPVENNRSFLGFYRLKILD